MKKLALTSLLAVFAVSGAHAATSPYVSAHVGLDSMALKYYNAAETHHGAFFNDTAYDLSLASGIKHDLGSAFAVRGELEFDFANGGIFKNEDGAQHFRSYTALANAYIDMKTASALTPYIGAGLGYQWSYLKDNEEDSFKPHAFAWQVGAGVSYALCDHMSLDLGYRYLQSVDKIVDEHEGDKRFATAYHQFRLGAAYAF